MAGKASIVWLIVVVGCALYPESDHYFLDGYPELIFRTREGEVVPTRFFIDRVGENGAIYYQVRDTSLRLTYRKDASPYTGFIRTFHRNRYNIEGVFKQGKIQRLRFWHPNRVLGMEMDFNTNVGQVWTLYGSRSISWNSSSKILYYPSTQLPREIHEDTLSTYFNSKGEVTHYTIRNDSMLHSYYPDGSPRFFMPNGISGTGMVKRWHPNGQVWVEGEYRHWKQVGVWIAYDTLGHEVTREFFDY